MQILAKILGWYKMLFDGCCSWQCCLCLELKLPFALWAASVSLHFRTAVCSVALCSGARLLQLHSFECSSSLPFILFIINWAGDISLLLKPLLKFRNVLNIAKVEPLLFWYKRKAIPSPLWNEATQKQILHVTRYYDTGWTGYHV